MRGLGLAGAVTLSAASSAAITAALLYFATGKFGGDNGTASIGSLDNGSGAKSDKGKPKHKKAYAQEIIDEQQARTRAFLKEEGMEKLASTKVVVVGLGGVGSWCATSLVRSGIGSIRLVDFDQVSLSSLNRHACATLKDVGTSKVNCLADYLNSIAPWCDIEPVNSLWTRNNGGPELLEGADYVVDCIDNIDTKVDLLEYCYKHDINVVSSMGAGAKADPTRIMVGDISDTYEDRLSRTVRLMLRARGINRGITTVFSTEKPGKEKAKLLDVPQEQIEQGNVNELAVLQKFRVGIIPVLGPLPGLFGLTLATHLLNLIGGYTHVFDPVLGGYSYAGKNRMKLYESLLSSIRSQIMRLKLGRPSCITMDDAEYLIEEVWRGKTIDGITTGQRLSLWDPEGPHSIHNMVPMSNEYQKRHEKLVFTEGKPLEEVYTEKELNEVRRRFNLDKYYMQYRVD